MGVQINGSEGNVIATKGTYSGNVTIGGTLTYEDVTNIDSVGLVTARSGIEIGARPGVGASISVDGNAIFSGITTATTIKSNTGIVTTLTSTTFNVDGGDATFKGTTSGRDVVFDTSLNQIRAQDNAKLCAGSSSDLEIFHNGTNSLIDNYTGALLLRNNVSSDNGGNIVIQAKVNEDSIVCNDDGAVELYHDNVKRFETSSTGGTLTGELEINTTTYDTLSITTTENGTNGPQVQLTHNSASPAASDYIGQLRFSGKDSAGNTDLYGRIACVIDDPTSGQETGHLQFSTRGYASINPILRLKNRGTASAPSYTSDDINGIILDVYNTGNPYPRYMNFIAKASGDTDSNIGFWTEEVGGSPTEKLRLNADGTIKYGMTFGSDTDGKIITLNSATHLCKTFLISGNYTMSSTLTKSSANSHPGTLEVRADADGPAIICGQLGRSNTAGAYSGLNISLEYPKLGLYAASVGGAYGAADFVLCNNSASSSAMATLSDEKFRIYTNGKIRSAYTYSGTTTGGGPIYVESDGDFLRYTSSRKYKTDIETLEDARADKILDCRPVWYRSLSENDIKTPGADKSDWGWYGFIAEEVAEIEPRLVNWATKDAKSEGVNGSVISVERDPSNYEAEGVRYDNFVPLLVNLVKRQKAEIESLKARLDAAGL